MLSVAMHATVADLVAWLQARQALATGLHVAPFFRSALTSAFYSPPALSHSQPSQRYLLVRAYACLKRRAIKKSLLLFAVNVFWSSHLLLFLFSFSLIRTIVPASLVRDYIHIFV